MENLYQRPEIMILPISIEGILCTSGSIEDMPEIELLEE